ncbi:DEAD/DEAH box helicase family protein [Sutcliffiella cohnii]
MKFQTLNLKPIYDTSTDSNVFDELFNKLLKSAITYKRGVGFFTSSWLEMCVDGLLSIAERKGKITLITSPHLEEKDWEAFRIGNEAKKNEVLYNGLHKQVFNIKHQMKKGKLTLLAWLIADDIITLKIAIPKNRLGDFHDKFAVFEDEAGDKIALHGSLNDSQKASYNGEGVSVFCSWQPGQDSFVKAHEERFDKLVNEENTFYYIYDLPSAIKSDIVRLRHQMPRPYPDPKPSTEVNMKIKIPSFINLFDYQQEAIAKWYENDCKGLFEMATGTGKTITALAASAQLVEDVNEPLTVLISVPFNHLVEQWEVEAKMFGFLPILCHGSSAAWKPKLRSKILDVNKGFRKNLCIISTHDTGSSDNFLNLIAKVKGPILYIGDESHYLGSMQFSKLLNPIFQYRIGLSATPDRWFDDEGSVRLREYFNVTVAEISITEAINKNFLTPYRFYPHIVHLSDDEYNNFNAITNRIIKIQNDKELTQSEKQHKISQKLIERSKIIGKAEQKQDVFIRLLEEKIKKVGVKNIKHTLVYCAPGQTEEVVRVLADYGIRAHEFIHKVPNNKRIELLEHFGKGEIQVLVAIKCLDEGVNIPATKEAYFLSSTTNPREFVQRRGRILRKSKGKREAIIHDFIVLPPIGRIGGEGTESILKREMPRFAEFADGALNEFEARRVILPILDTCNLRSLIDLKPWEAYRKMKEEGGGADEQE